MDQGGTMLSKILKSASAAALIVAIGVGASSAASAKDLVATAADPVGSLKDRMCQRYLDDVRAQTGDAVTIKYIKGEALGNAASVMEQHLSGTVDIFCNELVWFADYVPDLQILGWGFTFRNEDHMAAFFDSALFSDLSKIAIKQGARILSATPTQPRMMFTKKPVSSIDDVQGIKMRVPQLKSYLELWTALGTRPTQVAWSEVYLGLTTGVVVAAEGPPTDAMGQNFHQAAPYITRTDHLFSTVHISMNEATFQSLTGDQQAIVLQAAKKATNWARELATNEVNTMLAKAESEGATVSTIDKGPFQERSRSAVDRVEKEGLWRTGLWAEIQAL
jgi:TRAP-type C4-dicarboxylate transport system substrate-binding protein